MILVFGGGPSLPPCEQVEDNMKALDFVEKLTPEVMSQIDEAMGSKP